MTKLVSALNSINSQVWAFLVIGTGGAFVLAFHKAGIDIGIAAGVMGAGVQMFTSSSKHTPGEPQNPSEPGA
jgi:hypothetical protein